MKALLHSKTATGIHFQLGDVPIPEVSGRQVLLKVKATAVNRADIVQKKGHYPPPKGESKLLGLEVAGYVESLAKGCQLLQKGQPVCALLAGGGYAEYVAIDERLCMPISESMPFEEVAAIPEVFLTAYQALFWLGKVEKSNHVLIHAGASGVGTAAIQLCKAVEAIPIITASSTEKLTFCKQLGAELVINYKTEDFSERILAFTQGKGVNVMLDFVGASHSEKNLASMAKDSRWVLLGLLGGRKAEQFDFSKILMKRIHLIGTTLRTRDIDYKARLIAGFLTQFWASFQSGEIKPIIDAVFDWEAVEEAHKRMEQNLNIGKIVLRLP